MKEKVTKTEIEEISVFLFLKMTIYAIIHP